MEDILENEFAINQPAVFTLGKPFKVKISLIVFCYRHRGKKRNIEKASSALSRQCTSLISLCDAS